VALLPELTCNKCGALYDACDAKEGDHCSNNYCDGKLVSTKSKEESADE